MLNMFKSVFNVPDICPARLIFPAEERFLSRLTPTQKGNVSPVELSWLLFNRSRAVETGYIALHDVLMAARSTDIPRIHDDIDADDFMMHDYRIVARVALDPRRHDYFDFAEAFDNDQNIKSPRVGERRYFMNFHLDNEVVERL